MVIAPATESELRDVLRDAATPFDVTGLGTKRGLGRPVAASQTLSLQRFSGISLYEPEELLLEAGAATPLAEVEAALAARNQQLAFEPPNLAPLLGGKNAGSIAGVLMCNLSGPRRLSAGAARDHILRVQGITGDGVPFKGGARVVKNVTGYDLPKLMAGSFGTLAALTSVTFKVLPRAETEETLVLPGSECGPAVQAMSMAMQSACEVSAAAFVPGTGTCLRLEGIAASVAYRRDRLRKILDGATDVLTAAQSRALWASVRDVTALAAEPSDVIWKLSVPPSDAPHVLAIIGAEKFLLDWAGGLVWLALPADDDAGAARVRGALRTGHATLIRAPEVLRRRVAVFHPQVPALEALSRRVKVAFDARGNLCPGRMAEGR